MKNTSPDGFEQDPRLRTPAQDLNPLDPRQILWLAVIAVAVTGLVLVAFLPPFVGPEAGGLIMSGFRKVCHQLPSRSFHIGETQVALCHRCVGIYAAIPVAALLFGALRRWDGFVSRRPVLTIGASLVPIALDWGADVIGIWSNTPTSRLVSGAAFGVVAGYFLARAVVNAARSTPETVAEVPTEPAVQ